MFTKQFIDRTFWIALGSIAVTHLLAVLIRGSILELPFLLLVVFGCGFLAWRQLPIAIFVAFTEIMVGGHGHLLEASAWGFPLSLRSAIFVGVMSGWGIGLLVRRFVPKFVWSRDLPWFVLFLAVTIGFIIGASRHDFGKVFDDVNAYLTVGYLLPVISIIWDSKIKRQLLQVFAGSVAWITFMTLSLSFVFNHFPGKLLDPVYKFVRDSRLAEVTLQVYEPSYFYRVFMPSQLFVVIVCMVLLAMMLTLWRKERLPRSVMLAFVAVGATSLLSMSRSFALGFIAGSIIVGLVALVLYRREYKLIIWRTVLSIILAVGATLLSIATIIFPLPTRPDLSDAAFYKTSSSVGRSAGVASRWQLLDPLMTEIYQAPIWGSGFGTEVTYQSVDPRIIAETGNGQYTTFRFEWGYQDLWLKMGLLGLLSYIIYMACIGRAVVRTISQQENIWLPLGLGAGLVVLFVTHVFSPYLNHPIGIGYMLFVLPFLDFEVWKKTWVSLSLPQRLQLPVQEMSATMSQLPPSDI